MKKLWLTTLTVLIAAPIWSNLPLKPEDIPAKLEQNYTKIECTTHPIQRHHVAPNLRAPSSHKTDAHGSSTSQTTSSYNWSGYVAETDFNNPTSGSVTYVSGMWIVPALTATPDESLCSIWVGIDGFSNSTVEQIGTLHSWAGGKQSNFAWYEMYPAASIGFAGFPVDVGDEIQAVVKYSGNNTFQMYLINGTKLQYTSVTTQSTSTQCNSAEWIVETPDFISPMADFGNIVWAHCHAIINNVDGPINNNLWDNAAIDLITSNGPQKAYPTSLISTGTGFNVIWQHE